MLSWWNVVDRRLWPCSRSWIRWRRYEGVEVLRTLNVSRATLLTILCWTGSQCNVLSNGLAWDGSSWCFESDPSCVVLYSLQLLDAVTWSNMEHSIAVVDPGQDETTSQCLYQFLSQQVSNVSDGLCMVYNCTIAPPPRRACETTDADRARPPALWYHRLLAGRPAATDTDDTDGVTARSWLAVPTIRASDLSGLSCRPFCRYHCLTSVVHSARTAGVLSARMARWSCVSSAYWWYCTPWWAMTSAIGLQ